MTKKKAGCGQMLLGCLLFVVAGIVLSILGLSFTVDKINEHQAEQKAEKEAKILMSLSQENNVNSC